MLGLSIRWSLTEAADGVEEELAAFVAGTSHARFTGMSGLRFKLWRVRRGEWFEGTYVFATSEARAAFEEQFRAEAAEVPGSRMVGVPPALVEPFDVVAVAEGWEGFLAAPTFRD